MDLHLRTCWSIACAIAMIMKAMRAHYTKNLMVKHQCLSCVMSAELTAKASPEQKFECLICKVTKLKSFDVQLPCGHSSFCLQCVRKWEQNLCPICRQEHLNVPMPNNE